MNWLADAAAHYRMADALDAGKRVIRKVGNDWLLFFKRTGEPIGCYDSQTDALRAALTGPTEEPQTAKCFDCGQTFTYTDDDARVGATYAFCSEDCRSSFMAGLGA